MTVASQRNVWCSLKITPEIEDSSLLTNLLGSLLTRLKLFDLPSLGELTFCQFFSNFVLKQLVRF